MALNWSSEHFYVAIMHCLHEDTLPDIEIGAYFGMGSVLNDSQLQGSVDHDVFGTWQMMWRQGLLTKPRLLEAIRNNDIQGFFMDAAAKLAFNGGTGYPLRALRGKPAFTSLPALAADPPLDLKKELRLATDEALDTFAVPRFQTPATTKAAWERADAIAAAIVAAPTQNQANIRALQAFLESYKEAEDLYGASRRPPSGVAALVTRCKREFPHWFL